MRSKQHKTHFDSSQYLLDKRLVDVDHYDDLIAIKMVAKIIVQRFGEQHKDSPEMQLLKTALAYEHNAKVKHEGNEQ